jgi:hypothetical protein
LLVFSFYLKNLLIPEGTASLVLITEHGEKILPYKDMEYDLKAETGHEMILEVKGRQARIKESDCPARICVNTGWVEKCGDAAVCLPNKAAVYVRCVEGGYDAISR